MSVPTLSGLLAAIVQITLSSPLPYVKLVLPGCNINLRIRYVIYMICQPAVSPHLALVGPAVGATASRISIIYKATSCLRDLLWGQWTVPAKPWQFSGWQQKNLLEEQKVIFCCQPMNCQLNEFHRMQGW